MKGKQNKEKRYFCDAGYWRFTLYSMVGFIPILVISSLLTVAYINSVYVGQIEDKYPEQWYASAEQDEKFITLYRESKTSFDVIMNANGVINFSDENKMYMVERQDEQIVIKCMMLDDEGNITLDGITKMYKFDDLSELSEERLRSKQKYISDCKDEAFKKGRIWLYVLIPFVIAYIIALFAALDISYKRKKKAQT